MRETHHGKLYGCIHDVLEIPRNMVSCLEKPSICFPSENHYGNPITKNLTKSVGLSLYLDAPKIAFHSSISFDLGYCTLLIQTFWKLCEF